MRYPPTVYVLSKKYGVDADTALITYMTVFNDTDVLPTPEGYRVFFASRDYKIYRIDDKVFKKRSEAEKRRREVAVKLTEEILKSGLSEASSPIDVYEFILEHGVDGFKIADGIDDHPLVKMIFDIKRRNV